MMIPLLSLLSLQCEGKCCFNLHHDFLHVCGAGGQVGVGQAEVQPHLETAGAGSAPHSHFILYRG